MSLGRFDLIDYNALVAQTINENLIQQVNLQPILSMTQDAIGFVNAKTITIQQIADMVIACAKDDTSENEGEITFIVEEEHKYKWISIYMDFDSDKDKHKCSFEIIFSTEKSRAGQVFSFKAKQWFDSERRKISPALIASLSRLEHKLFRIYAAQIQVIDFYNDVDTYWSRYND